MEAAAQEQSAVGTLAGAFAGNIAGPVRVKTWDESTPEQRMEMMREEVRWLRRIVTDLERVARKMSSHEHTPHGGLVVPLRDRNDEDRPRGYFYDPLK